MDYDSDFDVMRKREMILKTVTREEVVQVAEIIKRVPTSEIHIVEDQMNKQDAAEAVEAGAEAVPLCNVPFNIIFRPFQGKKYFYSGIFFVVLFCSA